MPPFIKEVFMILENTGRRKFIHTTLNNLGKVDVLILAPKQHKEVPDEIAKQWLKSGEVREYVAPEDAKAKEKALIAENEALKKELEELKAKAETKKKKK